MYEAKENQIPEKQKNEREKTNDQIAENDLLVKNAEQREDYTQKTQPDPEKDKGGEKLGF
jgi:hypothetical protein